MRVLAVVGLLLAAASAAIPAPAEAQADDGGAPAESAARPDPDVHVDPATGERFRWARPTESLRRGPIPVPAWLAVAGGVAVAAAAGVMLVSRARRRR